VIEKQEARRVVGAWRVVFTRDTTSGRLRRRDDLVKTFLEKKFFFHRVHLTR